MIAPVIDDRSAAPHSCHTVAQQSASTARRHAEKAGGLITLPPTGLCLPPETAQSTSPSTSRPPPHPPSSTTTSSRLAAASATCSCSPSPPSPSVSPHSPSSSTRPTQPLPLPHASPSSSSTSTSASSRRPNSSPQTSSAGSTRSPTSLRSSASPDSDPDNPLLNPPDDHSPHPILPLLLSARQAWQSTLQSQPLSLQQARIYYHQKFYPLQPPPGFGQWFQFARLHNFTSAPSHGL
ncbi:hypothetical protein PTTG_28581 [Puccinia triticina 1-1 BBBD Race 1]|uniref:Uncharacterized protein n=1 Tax=Puccinia triticina (isolate 1-1 / race 1 (BBBD)) TaxID=630390 RepID=A0A180GB95_PUCT1|nr:hypothetical protein PTTG_28581 [Puccinia triticina 1-1 BBBD Race 1]